MEYSLDITIKNDTQPSASAAKGETKAEKVSTNEKNSAYAKLGKVLATGYASTALVRQAVHAEIGLLGAQTGNDYQTRVLEGTMNVAESAIGLGLTFAFSRVAGVVALAGKAVSIGYEAANKNIDIYKQHLEAGLVQQRAGGTFNRSRIAGRY